jgi:nucleoside-diphosphate-sugar epimerase
VLVTGGRGFLGRAVVKLLQRAGYEVVSLDAAPVTPGEDVAPHSEVVCDLTDAMALERVFERQQFGGVIHLAAILPTAAQRTPLRATQVNVEGSLHLMEMVRQFRVRRMVFGSSVSVYGTWPANQVISETERAAPEDLYGAAKLYVEQLGAAYQQSDGLEFVSLRIGRILGAGARSTTSPWRSQIFELLSSGHAAEIMLPYLGSETILLVHLDDVAKMLMALSQARHPAHATYNAVCESVVVDDLKREVESLNPNISVKLGPASANGNPRRLDSSRFREEFKFQSLPIFEHLRKAARDEI